MISSETIPFTQAMQNGAAGVLVVVILVALFLFVWLIKKLGGAAVTYLDKAGDKAGAAVEENTKATAALVGALRENERSAVDRHNASTSKILETIYSTERSAIDRHHDAKAHTESIVRSIKGG